MSYLHKYFIGSNVIAFSTMRQGGYSQGNYASFNINPYCGDDPQAVRKNRESLCQALMIPEKRLVLPHQVHGTECLDVNADFLTLAPFVRRERLEGVDALITTEENICIGVSTADCVPLLLYDEKQRAVAAIHAGWRGMQQRIVEKVTRLMIEEKHCSATDMRAVIGPSISRQAFEVGEDVYNAFQRAQFPMQQIASTLHGHWHIDLWEVAKLQLAACELQAERIHLAGVCTYYNTDQYFSARRLSFQSGRIFSGIMMN